MINEFDFVSARLGESEYPSGVLQLDGEKREAEAFFVKRLMFHKERVSFAKLTYDASTKLLQCKGELTVGGLTLRISDEVKLVQLAKLLMAPKEEAFALAEKALTSAMEEAGRFLAQRKEALSVVRRLERNPRELLIASASTIPDDADDPVSTVLKSLRGDLEASFAKARDSLKAGEVAIGEPFLQKAYAVVFAAGLYQDWLWLSDQGRRERATALMKELGMPLPSQDSPVSADGDMSGGLLSSGVTVLLSQMREAAGIA